VQVPQNTEHAPGKFAPGVAQKPAAVSPKSAGSSEQALDSGNPSQETVGLEVGLEVGEDDGAAVVGAAVGPNGLQPSRKSKNRNLSW